MANQKHIPFIPKMSIHFKPMRYIYCESETSSKLVTRAVFMRLLEQQPYPMEQVNIDLEGGYAYLFPYCPERAEAFIQMNREMAATYKRHYRNWQKLKAGMRKPELSLDMEMTEDGMTLGDHLSADETPEALFLMKECLAYQGEGELNAGKWCRFCKLRSTCRKRAEANLALAQHEFKLPPTLSDEEISVILGKLDDLTGWATDIREYALSAALSGTRFDGWKLVEGRANRRYTDEAAVAQAVISSGRDPYERRLLGVTAMEKLLGKKQFATLLADLVERPQGKPTLVPASDKRSEMTNAKNDFAND